MNADPTLAAVVAVAALTSALRRPDAMTSAIEIPPSGEVDRDPAAPIKGDMTWHLRLLVRA
jgi:hypothetical protein